MIYKKSFKTFVIFIIIIFTIQSTVLTSGVLFAHEKKSSMPQGIYNDLNIKMLFDNYTFRFKPYNKFIYYWGNNKSYFKSFSQIDSRFVKGRTDGKIAGKDAASIGWLAWGLFFGVFGFGGSIFYGLKVPAEKIVNKHPDYVEGFTESYKSSKRSRQMGLSGLGLAVWLAIIIGTSSSD